MNNSLRKVLFILIIILIISSNLLPSFPLIVTAPIALVLGLLFTNTLGNPYSKETSGWTKKLLQYSIIGLGFGINATEAFQASSDGLLLTVSTIIISLVAGVFLAKIMSINKNTGTLISVGTAICGGSAIAAVSPVINAENKEISLALGTVFTLNAIALIIFPFIGNALGLTQYQFGIWSAVAIHDTSSVVGASSKYGIEALKVATTVKLARALWIIPISIAASFMMNKSGHKISFPYFILWFLIAILLNSYIPFVNEIGKYIVVIAKSFMVVTLFLIGNSLTKSLIKTVGFKPFLLGVILWLILGVGSLVYIMNTM